MSDPSKNIVDAESDHLFLCYCSFVNNLKGKKLSIQNVFIYTMDEEKLKNILKMVLTLDTDQEIVRVFLDFDPLIAKSKFVSRYFKEKAREINKDGKPSRTKNL